MTYVQRCTKCWQPWNGWLGSICNQCKIIEEQQKSAYNQAKQAREAESERRYRESFHDYDDSQAYEEDTFVPLPNRLEDCNQEQLRIVKDLVDQIKAKRDSQINLERVQQQQQDQKAQKAQFIIQVLAIGGMGWLIWLIHSHHYLIAGSIIAGLSLMLGVLAMIK